MLERIIYTRLYKYITENNLLYCKQFGFQKGHSPEHAILQLVEQINKSFEKKEFILGVFVDLSKAFDTVDHQILLKKLEYYGIAGNNLRWFENYLKDQKQFISFEHNSTTKAITCGVPQGSTLGPLLFVLYVNDLHHASKVLNPTTFADDTNLFFSHSDINIKFEKVNKELANVSNWFKAKKLSLNVKKTKYSFFHKSSNKDYHSAAASESEPLFISLSVLIVYRINIYKSEQFMNKTKIKNVPHIFLKLFGVPCHAYPTNFSLINFSASQTFLKTTRFAISARGPIVLNSCLSINKKEIDNVQTKG